MAQINVILLLIKLVNDNTGSVLRSFAPSFIKASKTQ